MAVSVMVRSEVERFITRAGFAMRTGGEGRVRDEVRGGEDRFREEVRGGDSRVCNERPSMKRYEAPNFRSMSRKTVRAQVCGCWC